MAPAHGLTQGFAWPTMLSGPDQWFWLHVAQAVLFATLAIYSYWRLAELIKEPAHASALGSH